MGILIDGQWRDEELPAETANTGAFQRADSVFRDRITADGSSGFPAEAGRYHLYVAYTCPWAHRTQIYLRAEEAHRRHQRRHRRSRASDPRLDLRDAPPFRTARRTASTVFTTCTRPIPRAIRITPAR